MCKPRRVAWAGEGKRRDNVNVAVWPTTFKTLERYSVVLQVTKIRLIDMAVTALFTALDKAPKTRAAITANERALPNDLPRRPSAHDKGRVLYRRFGSIAGKDLPQGSSRTRAGLGQFEKPGS